MKRYKSSLLLEPLLAEVLELKYSLDGSGVLMAWSQSVWPKAVGPEVERAVREICWLRDAGPLYLMVNRVPPGVRVGQHTDALKGRRRVERWHLAVRTNALCSWWDAVNGVVAMEQGVWYGPAKYWESHSIENLGSEERVHLIVDLDKDHEDQGVLRAGG